MGISRNANTVSNQRGCLLGLAVGDALGAAVEFQPPGSFEPVTDYRAGGPHGLNPGEWTDDTSMALALADSLVQVGWDLNDQAQRYVDWWMNGEYSVNGTCFDIGLTVRSSLHEFATIGDARTSSNPSEAASGNGSIMRLAPVPIRYAELFPDNIVQLAELAAESSLPTHASPQCLSACRYFAAVLASLMHGQSRDVVLSPDWVGLKRLEENEPLHPKVKEVASGSFRRLEPPDIKGSGYVIKSLEAALWAFHDAPDFRTAVLRAVNLGDDADTTGAVCGQLAGAYWGESGIPDEWLEGLARRDMIEKALAGLIVKKSTAETPSPAFRLPSSSPPTVRCYWVVDGKFLAGAYPGSPDPDAHRKRIEELWDAGIRTFINLVEEDEKNLSGKPFTRYDDILRELANAAGESVAHLRFPVRDLSVPSVDRMRSILDAIDLSIQADRPVYVHCFGGVGRTGTAVCCWLQRHGFADASNVIEKLAVLREADKQTTGRKAPENREQISFVKNWLAANG